MNTTIDYDFNSVFQVLKDIQIEAKTFISNEPTTYGIQDILKMLHEQKGNITQFGIFESLGEYQNHLKEIEINSELAKEKIDDLKEQAIELGVGLYLEESDYIIEVTNPRLVLCASRAEAELAVLRDLLEHLGFDEEDYIIK